MDNPKRGRPRKSPEAGTERSHVARFLEELIVREGTQEKLVAKIGGKISRPLVAQILNDRVTATTAAVAALCRACDGEQVAQLLTAYLEDELARILSAYQPPPQAMWDGSLSGDLTVKTPPPTSATPYVQGWVAADALREQYFQEGKSEPTAHGSD